MIVKGVYSDHLHVDNIDTMVEKYYYRLSTLFSNCSHFIVNYSKFSNQIFLERNFCK